MTQEANWLCLGMRGLMDEVTQIDVAGHNGDRRHAHTDWPAA